VGIYGGTFNPIHLGHINAALDVQQSLQLDEMRMVLSATPPHRHQPELSAANRFALLESALQKQPLLIADDCELQRQGPSYMVDTLSTLRQQVTNKQSSISLVLGAEAFSSFMSWHRWQEIIQLAHIVVTTRAGFSDQLSDKLNNYIAPYITTDKSQLKELTHGKIYKLPVAVIDISATEIRRRLKTAEPVREFLPFSVWDIINKHGFYTKRALLGILPGVGSTTINKYRI